MLPAANDSRDHPRLSFGNSSDGFVGSEHGYVLKKRSRQRGNTAPIERNVAATRGLALAGGPLPAPTVETIEALVSTERFSSPYYNPSHVQYVPGHFQGISRPVQHPVAKNQSICANRQTGEHRPQQWDTAIRDQLSSITAPVRRGSESSESGPSEEYSSYNGEDVSDIGNDNVTSSSQFVPLVRAPSYADSPGYFDHTLHCLEGVDLPDSCDEAFWSQYNAID